MSATRFFSILRPYHEKKTFIRDTITVPQVAEKLNMLGIEPNWIGCFSWTDVFHNPFSLWFGCTY